MIKLTNWSSYQSYKDRRPPWIRLHKTLLDNYEFQSMSVNARALLPMLWLLASEDEDPTSGLIKDDFKKIAFRLRISEKDVKSGVQEITKSGFIESLESVTDSACNETVTKPYEIVTPETEAETYSKETETETEAVALWNECAKENGFSQCQKLSDTRRKKLKARLKDCNGIDGWKTALDKLSKSDFCKGNNDRGWKADFDFIITESRFISIMEDKYINKTGKQQNESYMEQLMDVAYGGNDETD